MKSDRIVPALQPSPASLPSTGWTSKVGRRAASLLSQLLVTTAAVALYAPLLYFLLVLLARPAPPTHSLDAITSALGTGVAIGELDVQFASPPAPSQDPHDRALSLALADRLSVAPSAVVVVAKSSRPSWQSSGVSAMEELPDQIVGDFTAALRLDDGRWRVVQSSAREVAERKGFEPL